MVRGKSTMNPTVSKFATLMGSASLLTLVNALAAQAQQVAQAQMAQAAPEEVPEQVLITGSLIHGAAAVGVPVTNLSVQDFRQTGAQTIGDLFRTVPQANVAPGASAVNSGGHLEREIRVNIRGLDQTGPRTLMLIDNIRFPPQADGICAIDPSIIPQLALDRIDILADGASATYGSDAIAGVINIVLKRGFDGAVSNLRFSTSSSGGNHFEASQLWGRTWDGGDVTLTYEWYDEQPVYGGKNSKLTSNFSPWGLDDRRPLGGSSPGTISRGAPANVDALGNPLNGNPATLGTSCTNCFAIPKGTGGPFVPGPGLGLGPAAGRGVASTLTWNGSSFDALNGAGTAGSGLHGTDNVFDTLIYGYELAPQQRNAAVMTIDQRLTKNISFFGEGLYSNRRVETRVAPATNPTQNDLFTVSVPTFNPYYPTGAGVPTNLRVSYDAALEIAPMLNAFEVSDRYAFGVNIDLPSDWHGQIYYSQSYDTNRYWHMGTVNRNLVSAALGWTIASIAGTGTTPGMASFVKPSTIPYMNLFCDAQAFQCNSPTTLNYITAVRLLGDKFWQNEKGAKFDGPLFNVPAGTVRAAVGMTYNSNAVLFERQNTTNGSPNQQLIYDSEPYQVWAGFAQLNIPVFGDNYSFPLFRKLDLEASWRHDQYYGTLVGATSNPKLGFTWELSEDLGATIRGGWGTSFRFANAGEYSTVASDANGNYGIPGFTQDGTIAVSCGPSGAPAAGSAAEKLFNAGFGCGSQPPGTSWSGGPQKLLRTYFDGASGLPTSRENGINLAPEKSTNWSIGFELAPTMTFLQGLDIQATWYSVKINGTLLGFNNPTANSLADPSQAFHYIVPSDLGCPVAQNATPALCAPFETMVLASFSDPNNTAPASALTTIAWINDGGTAGVGFLKVEGVDWNLSYDWDMGDLGAWNTGISGTYYLHRFQQTAAGSPIVDQYHQDLSAINGTAQNGVETLPRVKYRARLGWSSGAWSATGFVNYSSHYYHTMSAPPNVNHACIAPGSSVPVARDPNTGAPLSTVYDCALTGYTNLIPPYYTFDLSFGYDTGDTPTNDYLKNIGIQLVLGNIMDKHPAFEYGPTNSGRTVLGYDLLQSDLGRTYALTLTKSW